ncbi:MAG: hypothetical protein ACRBBK_06255 [Paracoccaceae bacterium]
MSEYLPREVREGLELARKKDLRQKSRLCVHVGEDVYKVLRFWETGFSLDAEDAPKLRGLVDLYDGPRHLYQCLIVATDEEGDQRIFEFKRATLAMDRAPLDFASERAEPVALIGR